MLILFRLDIADASKSALNEVNQAMDLYNKILRDVPWTNLKQKLNNLESYRNDYSSAAASIIAEIRGHMTNGIDAYKKATQSIFDWCSTAAQKLEAYIKLFDGVNAANLEKQKKILLDLLVAGVQKMEAAQDQLGKCSSRYVKLKFNAFIIQSVKIMTSY